MKTAYASWEESYMSYPYKAHLGWSAITQTVQWVSRRGTVEGSTCLLMSSETIWMQHHKATHGIAHTARMCPFYLHCFLHSWQCFRFLGTNSTLCSSGTRSGVAKLASRWPTLQRCSASLFQNQTQAFGPYHLHTVPCTEGKAVHHGHLKEVK